MKKKIWSAIWTATGITLSLSSISGIVSCGSKKEETKQPNTELDKKPNNNGGDLNSDKQPSKNNTYRIGHWNVLNFTGESKQDEKTDYLAEIINFNKLDLVGLTEVNNSSTAAKSLLAKLKIWDSNSEWGLIQSGKLSGNDASPQRLYGEAQAEYVSILYKKNKLKAIPFNDGNFPSNPYMEYRQGAFNNKPWDNYFLDKDQKAFAKWKTTNKGQKSTKTEASKTVAYARPPFGAIFQPKDSNDNKEKFITVFAHLDSPGAGTDDESSYSSQGTQELNETKHLPNVMNYFRIKSGNSPEERVENLVFLGDTNIKQKKEKMAFEDMFKNGYTSYLDENKDLTSLARTVGKYSQPYDKIFGKFVNSNFQNIKGGVYDLFKAPKDLNKPNLKGEDIDNKISDHTLVYLDFEIKK